MLRAYLEFGHKRVVAGAIDWPGYCRIGRDEAGAIELLVAYGPRYVGALGAAAAGFEAPKSSAQVDVIERLKGGATTDFGSPGEAPRDDDQPLDVQALEWLIAVLRESWAFFDRTAAAAAGQALRVGPRGGGRQVDAIVQHVLHAEVIYLGRLGGRFNEDAGQTTADATARVRALMVDGLRYRAHGVLPAPIGRRTAKPWSPRYTVRRSAWHALDHAWEIEDRRP